MVITDYPDAPLVENISRNVERNVSQEMRRAIDVKVSEGKANRAVMASLIFHGSRATFGEQILKSFWSRSNLTTIALKPPVMWVIPARTRLDRMDLMS